MNCSRQVILKATIVLSKLKTPNDFDALVLPGGLQGANAMKDSKKVKEIVQHYYSNNKWLGAICAAPIVLLEAKIAFGKKITSHPTVSKSLEADFDYQQDRVVVDGNLISSQGPGTAIEFALQIVESMMDEAIRKKVQDPLICKA